MATRMHLLQTAMAWDTQCCCDLDLDPMTLIYNLDLKILKMYLHTKNELSRLRFLKQTIPDRRTDR